MAPIGKLRHLVTIQEDTSDGSDRNDYNEQTAEWTTLIGGSVHAEVRQLQGTELQEAQQQVAEVSYIVNIRHLSTVTEEMRVLHDSRNLYIKVIRNMDERDRWTELLCEERK